MGVKVEFKYAPGELVDVPHLCIEGALIKLALLGRSGGKGYLVQSVYGGKPFEVEVFENSVRATEEEEEDEPEK